MKPPLLLSRPPYDIKSRNRTRTTLVGDDCYHPSLPPSLRPCKKKMPITHTSILLTRPIFASCVLQEYRDGREQGDANVNKELCVILVGCFYNVNQALENWIHITKTAVKDVPVIRQTFSFDRLVYHFSNENGQPRMGSMTLLLAILMAFLFFSCLFLVFFCMS